MARRRGGFDSFTKGFALGERMVDTYNEAQLRNDLKAAGREEVVEIPQYAPADEFDTGGQVTGSQQSFAGVTRDKPFSDTERDGLRAAKMASIYEKHGKTDEAMRLRALGRQATREAKADERQQGVDDYFKNRRDAETELEKMGTLTGPDAARAYQSWYKKVPNGEELLVDDEGNVSLSSGKAGQSLNIDAPGVLERLRAGAQSRLGAHYDKQYSNLGPEQAAQARGWKGQDRMFEETVRGRDLAQGNADRTFVAGRDDAKATQEFRNRELTARERALNKEDKGSVVTLYDEASGKSVPYRMTAKGLVPIAMPAGTSLSGPKDQTDDHLKRITTQLDENRALQKSMTARGSPGGDLFKFGTDDPDNQYQATLSRLAKEEQVLNEQFNAIRMSKLVPKKAEGEKAEPVAEKKPEPIKQVPQSGLHEAVRSGQINPWQKYQR